MTTLETDLLGDTRPPAPPPTEADADFAQKIAALIAAAPAAMLTTLAPDGSLRSRPMAPLQPPSENGEVWFFTADDSPKTSEIAAEHQVNLSYSDPARHHYVSLSGHAAILRDPVRTRRSWTPAAQTWFPGGPEDPRLVLLRVRVHTAHEWDAREQRMLEHRSRSAPRPAPPAAPLSPQEAAIESKMRLGL